MASLATVGTYYNPCDALIAKSLLEQHGFTVFLHDRYYTALSWDHVVAVGGLRLTVPDAEADDAVHLLSLTEPVPSAEADAIDCCPGCGSDNVFRYSYLSSILIGLWAVFTANTIFFARSKKRRCRECGRRWRI